MDDVVEWLWALGFIALVGVVFFTVVHFVDAVPERRRRDRIRQWAAQLGWTEQDPRTAPWTSRLPGTDPHGVSLMFSGEVDGRRFTVAEYTHIPSQPVRRPSTSRTGPPRHLVVVAIPVEASHPPVSVRPRGVLSRLRRIVGHGSAVATGNTGFDRQFQVTTEDPAAARRLLGPTLVTEHLAGRVPPWSVAGTELLGHWLGRIENPNQVRGLVASLARLAQLLGRS
jgi:hypothetical protein